MNLDERILRAVGQAVLDHITAQATAPLQARVAELEAELADLKTPLEEEPET